ncbi:MAG: hypothetical protein K6A94_09160 [Bacteroidales bacterium]|nr:hypothetical protein [Bacteroidales bacterium]
MVYRFTINVDRLEITYKANEPLQQMLSDIKDDVKIDALRLVREKSRYYTHEFLVLGSDYDETQGEIERPMGHLRFGSPNPNRQFIYFVFENAALYSEYLLASRFYIEDALGLEFMRVSKLDVAVDFSFNVVNRFYRVFKNPDYDLIINGVKVKDIQSVVPDVVHIAGNTTRKRPFARHTPVIRNADGNMLMRAYDKGREIDEESHKDYIRESAGFKRLYRIEVSLGCHKVVKKVLDRLGLTDGDLYAHLQNERTLIDLFRVALNSLVRVSRKRKSTSVLEPILSEV